MQSNDSAAGTGKILLGLMFVCTGATALLAEQIFEKLLGTLLGTSTPAAAVVLAIYFAGLTIGGWAYRFMRRSRRPLRTYALLEAGVGFWALILYAGFEQLITLFVPLLKLGGGSFALLQSMRFVVAAIWILPPTTLMGATFPAIADALSDVFAAGGKSVSWFYSLNLLGAVAAAAFAPFALFPNIGLGGTLLAASLIDLLVAASAYRLDGKLPAAVPRTQEEDAGEPESGRGSGLLLTAAFVTGCLFFTLEVLWTHLISVVCGNSIYAFSTMLAMVLIGLFAGGSIATRISARDERVSVAVPASFLAAAGVLLMIQQWAWPHVPQQFVNFAPHVRGFYGGELLRAIFAGILIVPVAAAAGSAFPLLFRLKEFPQRNRGVIAGAMTAANAVGCFVGALTTAFVVLPRLGSERSLEILAIVYVLLAFGVVLVSRRGPALAFATASALAVAALALLLPPWNRLELTSGKNVYFRPLFVQKESALLFFHEDTAGGITTVVQNSDAHRTMRVLLTNGKFQGNDAEERVAQLGFAVTPALFVPKFDRALVIGLGTGHSAAITSGLGFRQIDIAEIAPGITLAAKQCFAPTNDNVVDSPRARLHVEDGRNFLLLHDGRYDLITMEISSIWFAGATNLYSREFYEVARRRLAPGGVFQQWIQLHHIAPDEILSVVETLRSVFPHVSMWVVGAQGILVASEQPQVLQPAGTAAVQHVLATSAYLPADQRTIEYFLQQRLLSPEDVSRITAAYPAEMNTDRNRFLEYSTPRHNLSAVDWATNNILLLRQLATSSR